MLIMKSFIYIYIILLFLSIVYQPLGSYDMIGPQWFSISLVNLLFVIICLRFNYIEFLKKYIFSSLFKIYILFIFFSMLSIFVASDFSYYFHDLGRLLTSFVVLLNLSFCIYSIGIKRFSDLLYYIIVSMTFYEVYLSLSPYILYFKDAGFSNWMYINIPPGNFKGIAGNKNITAALFVFKIPFLLYFLNKKNLLFKSLTLVAIFFSFFILFFLKTRSTYVSILLLFIFYFAHLLIHNRHLFVHRFFSLVSIISLSFILFSNISSSIITNEKSFASSLKSIELSNESSSNRFSLWSHTIDYISKKPLGAGLGNWKLESIPYWKQIGGSYTVPYHAHNDFLEMTAEMGILGGLVYLFLFIFPLWVSFKYSFLNYKEDYILIFLGLGVYFVDAFFNFPMERSYMQLLLACYFTFFIFKQEFQKL